MMHDALVQIVLYAIKEQYVSEKAFYSTQLEITPQSWDRWKKDEQGLKPKNMQIIANLFTDYEWMLVQKVMRNATFFPEVEANPVAEYLNIKFHVAKKWVNSGSAELAFQNENAEEREDYHRKSTSTVLRIEMNYDFWSYKDRIELRLPGIIQQQIKTEKQDLLEWFKENIEETYKVE
ncbi:MAG: hypothetical protein RR725_02885 [Carnobacterium sp.]|nr:hypothetical protein [Carnobacterium sp. CS13]ALV21652.1 hypothetical protein NY10_1041 [Carnobacterium sp. CP1]